MTANALYSGNPSAGALLEWVSALFINLKSVRMNLLLTNQPPTFLRRMTDNSDRCVQPYNDSSLRWVGLPFQGIWFKKRVTGARRKHGTTPSGRQITGHCHQPKNQNSDTWRWNGTHFVLKSEKQGLFCTFAVQTRVNDVRNALSRRRLVPSFVLRFAKLSIIPWHKTFKRI